MIINIWAGWFNLGPKRNILNGKVFGMSFLRKSLAGVFLILALGGFGRAEAQTISSEPSLTGANYYVDGTNGSDLNTGKSIDGPFQSIQKGIDAAQPGDTVYIRTGKTVI